MPSYDPDIAPGPKAWLEIEESERIAMVSAYHRRRKINLPNERLHAAIHVVVENQIALAEDVVVNTLARLREEGLSRHDALHAIGSVLAKQLHDVMRDAGAAVEPNRRYLEQLQHLNAKTWRTS